MDTDQEPSGVSVTSPKKVEVAIDAIINNVVGLNKPDDFILAIVEFMDEQTHRVHYVRQPFQREPDFGVTSVNYDFAELLAKAEIMN